MASILTVTVDSAGVQNEYLILRPVVGTDPEVRLTFNGIQRGYGLVPIWTDINAQANAFANQFQGDYNTRNIYTVNRSANVITIEHFDNDHFLNFDDQSTSLTVSHANTTQGQTFAGVHTISEYSTDPCGSVNLNISVLPSGTADEITVTYNAGTLAEAQTQTTVVGTATFVIERGRNVTYAVTVGAETKRYPATIPPLFYIDRVDVANTISGATVDVITTDLGTGFNAKEYQIQVIDGSTPPPTETSYQSSSTFTNVVPGEWIVYARDQFGCVRNESIEIELQNNYKRAPFYSFVSPVNDFPFVLIKERTAGLNLNVNNLRSEHQPQKTGVTVKGEHYTYEAQQGKIQFRSSGQINKAFAVGCDDQEIELVVTQKSDFISKDTFLEGNYEYDATLDRLKLYFTTGNTYDIDGNVIGTHTYNNTLPNFYQIGLLIIIPGVGQGIIESIDRTGGVHYAITSLTNDLTATGAIFQSIHTEVGYEEYEVEYDVSQLTSDSFYLRITCAEDSAEQQSGDLKSLGYDLWETHLIHKLSDDELCNYHLIEYFGYKRHEINYKYGIVHRRWIAWEYQPIPMVEGDIEINQTDSHVDKIDYSGMRLFEMKTQPIANIIAVSLAEALGYAEFISVDRKEYATKEFPKLERVGVQRQTVTATLIAQNRIVSYAKFDGVTSDVIESGGRTSVANPFYPVVVD